MAYKKPQSPIVSGTDGIYPLTTADQIIRADGSRLEQNGKIVADDSAKLGGEPAATYARTADLTKKVAYTDVLTLEEIEASTNLNKKAASAEAAKGLVDRLGYIKHVAEFIIDINQTTNIVLPSDYRIYILISGHILFPKNNGIYMLVYHNASYPVRTIPLSGDWSAEITGDVNGKVKIATDGYGGCRGNVYMVASTA